jgi:hypothetical protein
MAQPKVHINDPTYTVDEVAEALEMNPGHVRFVMRVYWPMAETLDWPQFARLIVARKIHNTMPPQFKSDTVNTWPAIVQIVMEGPVPRAGRVAIRPDGSIYYIAGTMGSKEPEGISVVWDGQLKV